MTTLGGSDPFKDAHFFQPTDLPLDSFCRDPESVRQFRCGN